MKYVTRSLAALGMLAAVSAPAFATDFQDGVAMIISPQGEVTTTRPDSTVFAEALKAAKKISTETIILKHDGTLYLVPDQKMPDGKMLSEEMAKP